ncbi:MAG: SDR family oxidoreductase [Candidatus Sericytochromatia bacterium]|nr:SDR family oxidoreductase [Candidatus Tanganyikabacteria bacterium]
MDLGLAGRRALVTGASAGLGKAIAAALAAEGARVAICARGADRLELARAEVGAAAAFACDLSLPGAGAAAVEQAIAALGGLDILVTNSGGPPTGAFRDVSDQAWQAGFDGLWQSAAGAIRAALPGMTAARWGRVLLVTSVAAREPIAGLTVSNALRAGLLGLANSLSREVAGDGITVNVLLPGYTRTERLVELGVSDAKIGAEVPAGRLAMPEELAALAAFLASERAAYVTGQAIACDGGWLRSI